MNVRQGGDIVSNVPLLLCEGDSDERLLRRIFNSREVIVEHVGGSPNLVPVAAYWVNRNRPVFTPRDRDFRPLHEAEKCYEVDYAKRHFTWRRHELENYLIEPRVIANCFKQLQPHSKISLPGTEDSARVWLRDLARDLLEDQAGRRTAWELHQQLRSTLPLEYHVHHGGAIKSREQWEKHLVSEMEKIRSQAKPFEKFAQITDTDILQRYETNFQAFSQSSFFETDEYIKDFSGHEMVQKIYQEAGIKVTRYGIQELQNDLVESFVDEWNRDSSFLQPNDFAELQAAIRRQIGVLSSN